MNARTPSYRAELTPEYCNGRATPAHLGRTTQVWDAVVTIEGTERKIALFRCTRMVLWPK